MRILAFNLGKTEAGKQLLSKESMEDLRRATSAINVPSAWTTRPQFPFDDITTGYGYGWNIAEYRGKISTNASES